MEELIERPALIAVGKTPGGAVLESSTRVFSGEVVHESAVMDVVVGNLIEDMEERAGEPITLDGLKLVVMSEEFDGGVRPKPEKIIRQQTLPHEIYNHRTQ
jgi:hypothetical protein